MTQKMNKPDLKVVGEIKPPDYRDPVKMLRNLADNIEAGDYGTFTPSPSLPSVMLGWNYLAVEMIALGQLFRWCFMQHR